MRSLYERSTVKTIHVLLYLANDRKPREIHIEYIRSLKIINKTDPVLVEALDKQLEAYKYQADNLKKYVSNEVPEVPSDVIKDLKHNTKLKS